MRSAKSIIREYRKKGYTDERLHALAASREEPLRSQIMAELAQKEDAPAAPKKKARRAVGVLLQTEKLDTGMLPSPNADLIPELPGAAGEEAGLFDLPPQAADAADALPELAEVEIVLDESVSEVNNASEAADTEIVDIDVAVSVAEAADAAPVVAEAASDAPRTVLAGLEQEMERDHSLTLIIEEDIAFRLEAEDIPCAEERSVSDEEEVPAEIELESGHADEILRSAGLIIDAYERAGIEPTNEAPALIGQDSVEPSDGTYVAPELTLIECEAAEPEEDGMLHFQPEYALTAQQRAEAEERQQDAHYRDMARAIAADFERFARERQAEEPQLPCADFDELARPAEDDWAPEPVLVTVDDGVVAAAEESTRELARLRGWLNELEDGLKMRELEQNRLLHDLNDRDETVVVLGRQLAAVEDAKEAAASQTEHDSMVIARTQNLLCEQRARLEQLHGENIRLNEEVARLGESIQNNAGIIGSQSEEVMHLRRQLEDLNHGADELVRHNRELAGALQQHEGEAARLREQAQQHVRQIEELSTRESELQARAQELHQMQLDYNILANETLPNLQADKEELIELVGEESGRCVRFEELAAARARRSSYSVAIAAAACVLMVLTPVLSWHTRETDRLQMETSLSTKLAQADSVRNALQAERDALKNNLQAVRAKLNQNQEELALLKSGGNPSDIAARPISTSDGRTYDPSAFDTTPVARGNPADSGISADHSNGVSGIDEWRVAKGTGTPRDGGTPSLEGGRTTAEVRETAKPTETAAADVTKTVQVRKGEGLSQVLWRVYGSNSTPEMLKYVIKTNNLAVDKRGNPSLRVDQELKLPADPRTAMVTD